MSEKSQLTLILLPEGGEESRTYRVRYRTLRILRALGFGAAAGMVFILGSWVLLLGRSSRLADAEAELQALRAEQAQVPALMQQLQSLESEYEQLRSLFAPSGNAAPGALWLPPPGGRRSSARRDADGAVPDSWPLTERGFVTQGRFETDDAFHPGLDIAVPRDSYIRAAGSGTVSEVGEDPTYGRYVRVDHGNGYETLYAHASATLVDAGEHVRKNEVIALSGSTGQSTAPHLHFEILRDGESLDPLEVVTQP
jgi:murein DD-endopeptidase MepM/ murein hydrolase activator NlpD